MGQVTLANPHWEALTPETRQAFCKAAGLPFIGQFYLAGGTGLALHLGHRFSVDLDFYSPALDAVGPEVRAALREALDDPTLSIAHDMETLKTKRRHKTTAFLAILILYSSLRLVGLVEGRSRK